MTKPLHCFANFPVNKHPSTSEVIRRYRSTYEGCDLVPLVTSSIGDSEEVIIHFQEAYARLFPNCSNKQGIQSNLPSYTPMNQGTICAKEYPLFVIYFCDSISVYIGPSPKEMEKEKRKDR